MSASLDAGALRLWPGLARPHNLKSTRPQWVGPLTRGLPATQLPARLGSLFSLCGHAHQTCAAMAVEAAKGVAPAADSPRAQARAQALARQTLQEHLRRIWLDWPRLLPAAPTSDDTWATSAGTLAQCPIWSAPTADAAPWLAEHLFGMPAEEWLAEWDAHSQAWLQHWSETAATPLAAWWRAVEPALTAPLPTGVPLHVHADAQGLQQWSAQLGVGEFAQRPLWRGACAETGVWTRLSQPLPLSVAHAAQTPAIRMGARLAEVARLALPGGECWLDMGAMPLGAGSGVAWLEMSRGSLVHHVRLEGSGADAKVAACHVVAPTEWNFHPQGPVARVLEGLPARLDAGAQERLAAVVLAYDPCVPYRVETAEVNEACHA